VWSCVGICGWMVVGSVLWHDVPGETIWNNKIP